MPPTTQLPSLFEQVFARPAEIASRAPGRDNLIGEHVDYQGGLVMPAAIDRYVTAIARPNARPEVHLSSSQNNGDLVVPLEHDTPFSGDDSWANYAIGVVAKYRDADHPVIGFEVEFDSDLPLGAGVGGGRRPSGGP